MQTILTHEQLIHRVGELAATQVGADPAGVTAETHLFADLNYDSLDAVELTMTLEEEFEIVIPDEEAEKAQTIGKIVELLEAVRR